MCRPSTINLSRRGHSKIFLEESVSYDPIACMAVLEPDSEKHLDVKMSEDNLLQCHTDSHYFSIEGGFFIFRQKHRNNGKYILAPTFGECSVKQPFV
ncbi:hypothetical protein CDAR_319561 [Caerostris darwini]|uniref:Uncharacterized protein n=1 Tax=Caerostris darwini TaxID=1538125 RepID=A0AAV4V9M5_9ARAC|nr:hypothetical protein CDAR_319561 [Caerostris darwini]